MIVNESYFSTEEAARALGLSLPVMRRYIKSKRLKSIEKDGQKLVHWLDLIGLTPSTSMKIRVAINHFAALTDSESESAMAELEDRFPKVAEHLRDEFDP